MRNSKIVLVLVAILFISAQCIISDIITTSSNAADKAKQNKLKKIVPKEHFCSEGRIKKLTCQVKAKNACKGVNLNQPNPICGFDSLGQRYDFKQECEAC